MTLRQCGLTLGFAGGRRSETRPTMKVRKTVSRRIDRRADGVHVRVAVDAALAIDVNEPGGAEDDSAAPDPSEEAQDHGRRDEAPHA